MKNIFKKTAFLLIGMCSVLAAWGVPARPGLRPLTLQDGSKIMVEQHGDEFFHWMTNEQGEWIEQQEDGSLLKVPALSPEKIAQRRRQHPNYAPQQAQLGSLNLAPKGLVIMVNFKDLAFNTPKDTIDSMLNGQNFTRTYNYLYIDGKTQIYINSRGSARQYFFDSSHGQYQPRFDLQGPITLSKTMEYYGKGSHDNQGHVQEMIKEACDSIYARGVDFSQYDADKNGQVDFVYVLYAGYAESDGGGVNTIWPCQLSRTIGTYNGKTVSSSACSSEMNNYSKQYYGIGVFCHEFSHVIGLPDLYATTGGTHKTLGYWDIMDQGVYCQEGDIPPAYSAYERFFAGWTTPRLLNAAENVTLQDIQKSNEALIISPTGTHNLSGTQPNPTEFYLLENRQRYKWHSGAPGHGLLLTKVTYSSSKWTSNTVNNTATSMGIDLIEADGIAPTDNDDRWIGKPGDLFPTGATEYTKITNYPITDITETDSVIFFLFMGGVPTELPLHQTADSHHQIVYQNGRILIIRGGETYDLMGRKYE